jgi:hypothetical protein
MALLTTQQMTSAGAALTLAAANVGGDTADISNGRTFLWCKNASGGAITVTLATPGDVEGLAIADRTVSVPATTGERMIGPLNPAVYGSIATITYSGVTSFTVAAVSV